MPYTTRIILFSGVPFDTGYKNTLYPVSRTTKLNYLLNQQYISHVELNNYMQFKIDTNTGFGTMRLSINAGSADDYNYAYIEDKGGSMFLFLLGCEYINDGKNNLAVYQYKFKKDVVMTHLVAENLLYPAPIIRHHSTNRFNNPYVPETYGVGKPQIRRVQVLDPELFIDGYPSEDRQKYCCVIKFLREGEFQETYDDVTDASSTTSQALELHNGKIRNLTYVYGEGTAFQGVADPTTTVACDIDGLIPFADQMMRCGGVKIVDAYMVPKWMIKSALGNYYNDPGYLPQQMQGIITPLGTLGTVRRVTNNCSSAKQNLYAQEFTPRDYTCAKLSMYPYSYGIAAGDGQSMTLKYEEWMRTNNPFDPESHQGDGQIYHEFEVCGCMTNPVSIDYYPLDYGSYNGLVTVPYTTGQGGTLLVHTDSPAGHITIGNFPTCAWAESAYSQAVGAGKIIDSKAMDTAWGEFSEGMNPVLSAVLKPVLGPLVGMSDPYYRNSVGKYMSVTGVPNLVGAGANAISQQMGAGVNNAASASSGIGGIFSNLINNQISAYKTATAAQLTPPTYRGSAASSAGFVRNMKCLTFYNYSLNDNDCKNVRSIFDRYGYAQGGVYKKPDISGRPRYCYVETGGETFKPGVGESRCNSNEAVEINKAFMEGIMFWNPANAHNNISAGCGHDAVDSLLILRSSDGNTYNGNDPCWNQLTSLSPPRFNNQEGL